MIGEAAIRKAQGERLRTARMAAGYRSAREAAIESGWPESSYRAHETGTRTIGRDDAERYAKRYRAAGVNISARDILFGTEEEITEPVDNRIVAVMGLIGAGAEIFPDFEQVPEEGLDQVKLPFAVPEEMVGFEVRGDSMLPRYDDGDVVVCWKEQRRETKSFIGEEAAVRTDNGRRYLKRLARGPGNGAFNLESSNARTIEGVQVEWVGEIFVIVPRGQLRRLEARERAVAKRRAAARAKEIAGMEKLPLGEAE